jgi:tetratricopeptide (TPR) repeat protein
MRVAAAALLALLAGASAAAEPESTGKLHFDRGLKWMHVGDYEQALVEFRKSFVANPRRSSPVLNAALCHERLSELTYEPELVLRNKRLALTLYENVLQIETARPEHRKIAESRIPKLKEDIEQLELDRIRQKEEERLDDKTHRILDTFVRELLWRWKTNESQVLDRCPAYCR